MMSRLGLALLLTISIATSAHSKPLLLKPIPGRANVPLSLDATPPGKDLLPSPYALVPSTSFIMMQSKGGSILLGPIFGAMNTKATSNKLAKSSIGGYMGVDVVAIAANSLARLGVDGSQKADAYAIKPFAYIEQCGDDEMYRLALAYQVKAPGKKGWTGRYVIHLPTAIPFAQFNAPTPEQVAAFTTELTASAETLTTLLSREIRGEIPLEGREVQIGSLHFIGNKLGGMGIYTMAKDLYVNRAQLVEERDGNVVVRIAAVQSTYLFGTHVIQRSLVHKLDDMK
jgi:hypothetical protein